MRKFFISYTSKDSQKAQWIGWTLKQLGHEAHVHEWEVGAGQSIPDWMEQTVGVVHVLVPGEAPIDGLAKETDDTVPTVLGGSAVGQNIPRHPVRPNASSSSR